MAALHVSLPYRACIDSVVQPTHYIIKYILLWRRRKCKLVSLNSIATLNIWCGQIRSNRGIASLYEATSTKGMRSEQTSKAD